MKQQLRIAGIIAILTIIAVLTAIVLPFPANVIGVMSITFIVPILIVKIAHRHE